MSIKRTVPALLLAVLCALSLCACASSQTARDASQPAETPAAGEVRTVEVSDVDALLDAIGPNTEIVLAPGRYNLAKASLYGEIGDNRYISWDSFGFSGEYGLHVFDADNLTIRGDHAEIVTEPRSVNVIAFSFCENLRLEGIRIGHTKAAEPCQGGVVCLKGCRSASIEDCGLFGCGTIGVSAERADGLSVVNCDIYSCSSGAVSCLDCRGLTVDGSRIYDCGTVDGIVTGYSVINLNNVKNAQITGCDIYDNHGYSLIWQPGNSEISVSDVKIHGNNLDCMFTPDEVSYSALDIRDNVLDRWISGEGGDTVSLDGKTLKEDALEALYPGQLSSDGIGTLEVKPAEVSTDGAKEVHVRTADEFLKAIASDTFIYIDVPKIDLTTASDYGKNASEEYYTPDFSKGSYVWNTVFDGYELAIGFVSNFHIAGGEIVTTPGYANVISFWNCTQISLENVTLGHDREPGTCCGGVVCLNSCNSVIIESCDIYGCGVIGIETSDAYDVYVQNTRIHDCSYSGAELRESDGIYFIGCTVENCPDPGIILYGCENFSWDGKRMDPFASFSPKK